MTFERILVPLDGSQPAEQALIHASRLARAFGSRILLLRVLDTQSPMCGQHPDSVGWRLHRLEAIRYIRSAAEHAALRGLQGDWYLVEGRPAEQIMQFAQSQGVDLVILSAHGQGGAYEFPFGGTAQKIATAPGVSCIVLRDNGREQGESTHYRKILVPLDGSRRAEWAVNVAAGMAADAPTEIVLLQVVAMPEMPRRRPLTAEERTLHERLAECNRNAAEIYLREVRDNYGAALPVRTRMETSGRVAQTILDVASEENADLIVMAAHEPGDEDVCNYKAVCQYVLTRSRRPVLVLQHDDYRIGPAVTLPEVNVQERKLAAS